MDDYMREMVDLKTLVTKTLEKKGVLARIRVRFYSSLSMSVSGARFATCISFFYTYSSY